jgi:hypothetical protein
MGGYYGLASTEFSCPSPGPRNNVHFFYISPLTDKRKSMAYGWDSLNNKAIVYGGSYRDTIYGDLWITTNTCDHSNCFCLQELFTVTNSRCNGDGTIVVEDHLEIASDVEIPAGAVLQVQGNLTVTGSSFKMNSKSNITVMSNLNINSRSVLHIILDAPSKIPTIV